MSFQSIFFLFFGVPRSSAWITVKVSAGYRFCFPIGGRTRTLAEPDLENGFVRIAVAVSNFDAMQSLDRDFIHFLGDRVIPVTSQPVDTGPNQEMRSDLLCRAEKLVDIALAITDMDASSWIIQKFRRLLQIVQPSDAFLLLDGYSRRVDLLLERGGPFEFLPSP